MEGIHFPPSLYLPAKLEEMKVKNKKKWMQKDSDCVTFGYKHEALLDCCSIAVEINTLPKKDPFIGTHSKYRSWYNGRKPNVVAR